MKRSTRTDLQQSKLAGTLAKESMMKSLTFVVIAALSYIMMTVVFLVFSSSKVGPLGFLGDAGWSSSEWRACLLSLFTIVGILSRQIYLNLVSDGDSATSVSKVFASSLTSKSLWIALIACPIVIVSFYQTIEEISSTALVCLLAYENGFFFKTVLEGKP